MVEILAGWASLPLRILLGVIFLYHGYPKIKDLKQTAGFVGKLGFAPAFLWAFALAAAEFFGGVSFLSGFATRLFAGTLIFSMGVATYFKKFVWKKPFMEGYELDLLVIAALASLFLLGSGNVSVDSLIGWILG